MHAVEIVINALQTGSRSADDIPRLATRVIPCRSAGCVGVRRLRLLQVMEARLCAGGWLPIYQLAAGVKCTLHALG